MPKKRYNAKEIPHSLRVAQLLIDQWRVFYNTKRPHSSLGYRRPAPEKKMPDQEISMQKMPRELTFKLERLMHDGHL